MLGRGGNDTLFGGPETDFIKGGEGVDAMYGGDGDDTFVIWGSFAAPTATMQTPTTRIPCGMNPVMCSETAC